MTRPVLSCSLALGCGFALAAGPALAHPGQVGSAFSDGLAHPLGGADHMLAMMAVGLLAARRGGTTRLVWPAAFVLAMLAGYGMGAAGTIGLPIEPAILASVIVLGSLAASSVQIAAAAGALPIAAFGFSHGLAHGAEARGGADAAFALGFAVSTLALHGLGLALGSTAQRRSRPLLLRLMGGGVAAGGLALALVG